MTIIDNTRILNNGLPEVYRTDCIGSYTAAMITDITHLLVSTYNSQRL